MEKGLDTDEVVLAIYDKFADALYRRDEQLSIECLASWAVGRRHIHKRKFEKYVIDLTVDEDDFISESVRDIDRPKVQEALEEVTAHAKTLESILTLLHKGESEQVQLHYDTQKNLTEEYVIECDSLHKVLIKLRRRKIVEKNLIDPDFFFIKYCTPMENHRTYLLAAAIQ